MDRDELEAWLEGKPRSWAVVIAARAALRAVPYAAYGVEAHGDRNRALALAALRASASALAYAGYPAQSDAAVAAARSASVSAAAAEAEARSAVVAASRTPAKAPAFAVAAAAALSAAADAVLAVFVDAGAYAAVSSVVDAANAYANAEEDAAYPAAAAYAVIWTEIDFDIELLSVSQESPDKTAARLSHSKLWKQQPGEVAQRWNEVKAELLRTVKGEEARGKGLHLDEAERRRLAALEAEDWGVWTAWYERVRAGEATNEALEIERVTSDAIPWGQGPKLANRALREIEEKHRLIAKLRPAQLPRVNPETGEIGREPLAERPPVKENFAPADAVRNRADALREIMAWQRAQASWAQEYRFLDFQFAPLLRLLDQSPLQPVPIHDACDATVRLLDSQIAREAVSDSSETMQLRMEFEETARDIRFHYPDVAAMQAARAGTTAPPTDEARREQLDEAVKALSAILETEYAEALREDIEAVRLSDAQLPAGDALSNVDLGERRRLAENLARIWLMLRDGGKKALEVVEDSVTRAKKLTEYAKVARELGKIWDELKDWIGGFL